VEGRSLKKTKRRKSQKDARSASGSFASIQFWKRIDMADIHKPFVALFIAFIGSLFIHENIKNIVPYSLMISIIIFVLIYAGVVYLLRI